MQYNTAVNILSLPSLVVAWQYSDGKPVTGALNVDDLDSQRISGFAIGNCCTVASLWHLATGFC